MTVWNKYLEMYKDFVRRFPNWLLTIASGIYLMLFACGLVESYLGVYAGKVCVLIACLALLVLSPAAIATVVANTRARRAANAER